MPGFLIFEEFGMDFEKMGVMGKVAKAALQRVPGSWMAHGIPGEKGVDVDPVALMNKIADGQNPLAGGVNSFFDPYKGWIHVASVSQTVSSTAETSKRDLINELEAANQEMERQTREFQPGGAGIGINEPLTRPPAPDQGGGGVYKTGLTEKGDGVERLSVEVHVDASFPHLLKTALKPKKVTDGKIQKKCADIHMCNHSALNLDAITFGSDSPAATMIKTLLSIGVADVIPYLTIHLTDVSIEEVSFNMLGETEATVPTASITLEYEKIKWTYHVINGSNMNLFDVDFTYDVKKRKPPKSLMSLGKALNPFT